MKKLLLSIVCLMTVAGSAWATSYNLNQLTTSSEKDAASPWSFDDGFTIKNVNGKTLSFGKESGIKYSAGVQYTVTIPDGISIAHL